MHLFEFFNILFLKNIFWVLLDFALMSIPLGFKPSGWQIRGEPDKPLSCNAWLLRRLLKLTEIICSSVSGR
jgi:hypothetical protein